MDIGEKIKTIRISKGMTLEQVGEIVGVGNVISSTQFFNIFCHFSSLKTKKKKPRKLNVFRAFGGEGGI